MERFTLRGSQHSRNVLLLRLRPRVRARGIKFPRRSWYMSAARLTVGGLFALALALPDTSRDAAGEEAGIVAALADPDHRGFLGARGPGDEIGAPTPR